MLKTRALKTSSIKSYGPFTFWSLCLQKISFFIGPKFWYRRPTFFLWFIVQTYLSFTHYDDFIKGSVFFYFVYIFGVTLIITDFSDWIVIITTQDRTAKEEWSLWTWNSLYVLTGALTLVPVMGSVICVLDPEAGDELFLPKLILKIYVGAWIGRLIMAAFVAHFKTFKAWMFFVRHDKEYGNIEDKLATRKALRILKPKTEYFNPKGYAKRKDEWVKMESTFVEEDTRMEDNIANFGRNESVPGDCR